MQTPFDQNTMTMLMDASSELGEVAVFSDTDITIWRMSPGGAVINFVARIGAMDPFVCYAGTNLMVRHIVAMEDTLTIICRRTRGSFSTACNGIFPGTVCQICANGDIFAVRFADVCGCFANVYRVHASQRLVLLHQIVSTQCARLPLLLDAQVTKCHAYLLLPRTERTQVSFYITPAGTRLESRPYTSEHVGLTPNYVEEPVADGYFRKPVWVHDSIGLLNLMKRRKPCFMFSCLPDQYAFTRNVSDVKHAWMGACVQ
jgi:hypothetical protein